MAGIGQLLQDDRAGLQHRPNATGRRAGRRWATSAGEETASCTIITTEANDLVSTIQDPMPVILPRQVEDVWLDPENPSARLLDLLKPHPVRRWSFTP